MKFIVRDNVWLPLYRWTLLNLVDTTSTTEAYQGINENITDQEKDLIINGIPINHEKPSFKLGSEVSGDKLRDSLLLTSNLFKLNI